MDLRINGTGSFPLQAAKAYGVRPKPLPAASPLTPALPARPPDRFEPSKNVDGLIAGNVSQSVHFEAASRPSAAAATHALQMYTRAADKVEAAVAVQIGRTLDVQG